jgi:hypothetical protein
MTREEQLGSTHLLAERMRSESLQNADIDVDPDGGRPCSPIRRT